MANGSTSPFGWLPALYARNLPPAIGAWFAIASARIDRAELPVQRNSTFNGGSAVGFIAGKTIGIIGEHGVDVEREQVMLHFAADVRESSGRSA